MTNPDQCIRVYADTSVYGGFFDAAFSLASRQFFKQVNQGLFRLVVSRVVENEIKDAPPSVRRLFDTTRANAEAVDVTEEAVALRRAYIEAKVVGPKWEADALHVALATITRCSVIVSWNFKHIVNFQKISCYNAVNTGRGYAPIAIHTPQEVCIDERDEI